MNMYRLIGGFVLATLTVPAIVQAATLNVVDGQLQGASGVDVGGTLYNVSFQDGTCQALYDGCDEASDLPFSTQADGELAAQALLDQVFLDGAAGQFDSDPETIAGCTFVNSCTAYVPYRLATANQGTVVVAGAINKAAGQGADAVGSNTFLDRDEFVPAGSNTFAVFTVVPIPAAVWLFVSALAGLGFLRRR